MKTKPQLLARTAKFTCLFASVLAGLIQTASAYLTIQIVNDSGLSDSNIYIMVPGATGATINPQSLFVDKDSGTNTSVALSTLATNSWGTSTIISPISGNTDTVYSFQASKITSGGIYFIYNNPFTFKNGTTPSPSPDGGNGGSGFRYDYAELSFLGGDVNNDVDLTYVDKFGIPLQLEWFHGTNTDATNLMAGSYVYASTKTLANLFAASGFANAVFSLTNAGTANGNITPGWQYTGLDSYSNFARIVSPEKASGTGASVSPYPDVANYLNFLINNPFTLNGYSVQGGSVSGTNEMGTTITTNYLYYYLGYQTSVAANGSGGWTFTLSYKPNLLPANYNLTAIGATTNSNSTNVDIPVQYTNTITFTVPDTNTTICASADIYGAPVGTNYLVNDAPVADNTHTSYNVEAWMIGDVLSSLNFGFAGGIYGTNSEQWYSPKVDWTSYPYGWAQPSPYNNPTNGYYNPYAALMYYNADAYTFAFSERITPDVGMPVENGDIIRITILPDDRLDSPIPEVETNSSSSITLNWNPVAGATGYRVNMLRPLGIGSTNITSTSYTFNGLIPGAPYVMSVQATGTANGNSIITPARPITATTAGDYATTNGNFIKMQAVLDGVVDPFSQLQAAYINGIELTPQTNGSWQVSGGGNAGWMAWQGTNQVVVKIVDQNSNVVFDDWATFVLSPTFASNGTNYTTISDINFYGQLTGATPTFAADFVGDNIPTNDTSAVIGLVYTPTEIRKFNPLNVITPVAPSVTITDVTSLPGGRIQFDFNVHEGTNYAVESSANLIDWQTNFTGTGLTGGEESYTNTVETNMSQFYRIQY
ncbi:MAG: fibronectin type III domain-containing protein [Limisphaerales bacterium]